MNIEERELRQRIAALSGEEVSIALEIMLTLHPNRYLNTLAQGYISKMSDLSAVASVINSRDNYIKIITGEIADPAGYIEEETEELENEEVDTPEEPVNKLEVPEFLG